MQKTATAYLGIGSNLGDRLALIQGAIEAMKSSGHITRVRISPLYETTPVGPIEQDDFLNGVVEVETTLRPFALLNFTRQLEIQAGRKRTVRWGPRTLDLDLLAQDQEVIATPELTLPHPEASQRPFVLVPWSDLAPNFFLRGKSICDWLKKLDCSGVRKFDCA